MSSPEDVTESDVSYRLPADWADHLDDFRARLLKLAETKLDPQLRGQYAPEDILQETYTQILEHPDRITAFEDASAPLYFRIRAQLFANLTRIARAHFQTKKRNAACEGALSIFCSTPESQITSLKAFDQLSAAVSDPRSAVDRLEQQALVRDAVQSMNFEDRSILTLHHFDGCPIAECMQILGLTRREYNARYIKALRHLKIKLSRRSVFRNDSH